MAPGEVPSEVMLRGEGLADMSPEQFDALVRRLGKQGIDVVTAEGLAEQDAVTREFFGGSPEAVAEDLIDKSLVIGDRHGTITAALPRTERDNANWLHKPLFGPYPVDVYASPFRGSYLLFLRTGQPNTCVRIDGLETARKSLHRPGLVSKYLGIKSERTGNVAYDGRETVTISWL